MAVRSYDSFSTSLLNHTVPYKYSEPTAGRFRSV